MPFVLPGNARTLRFTGESKSLAPPSKEPPSKEPSHGGLALGKPRVRKPPAPKPGAHVMSPPAPSARVMPMLPPTPSARVMPMLPPTPSARMMPMLPPTPSARVMPMLPPSAHVMSPPTPERFQPPAPPIHCAPAISASRDLYRVDPVPTPYAASYLNAKSSLAAGENIGDESVDDEIATRAMERAALDFLPDGVAPMPRPVSPAPIPHFRPVSAFPAIVPHTVSTNVTVTGAPLAVWLVAAVLVGVVSYFVVPDVMARVETTSATSRR